MSRIKGVFLCAAVVACSLLVAAHASIAAKPSRGNTKPVTVIFRDSTSDFIRSDGLGSYSGSINLQTGDLTLSTGSRSLFFDFSQPETQDSFDPFGDTADSGLISEVTMTARWVDGDPGKSDIAVFFDFRAPAPDGTGPTDWRIDVVYYGWATVERLDTDGDSITDTYVLTSALTIDGFPVVSRLGWWTDPEQIDVVAPRRGPPTKDDGWRLAGTFVMPWTATARDQ